ncbi:hypothetical protein E3N88_12135 [Mikania micrantha]|uniref:Myb/SANT-like domain-containing protein n=1 Tax=Mikania micrantha TaxID=192012 RepID=A0A5N6P782_9ASTR|nr:hypothetical protein E3N88_12135 [Mikania micrantha]
MGEKQQWSNEHIKCLLETCIEEINSVGKKGLSLHKDSWIKLGRVLKEKFGLDLTQKQMKNAYDNLKAKYIEDDAGTSHQTSEPIPDHTSDPNFEPASEPIPEPTREPTPESNPRKKSKTTKSSSINADDLAHDMRKALQYLIKGNEGPTVVVCSEKLKLVGLDPVDPLFLAAFHIFGVSTGMREAWMALPDIPDVLRGWIAMTATSLGLIK